MGDMVAKARFTLLNKLISLWVILKSIRHNLFFQFLHRLSHVENILKGYGTNNIWSWQATPSSPTNFHYFSNRRSDNE